MLELLSHRDTVCSGLMVKTHLYQLIWIIYCVLPSGGICARFPFSARYSVFWTDGENSPLSDDMDHLLCIT